MSPEALEEKKYSQLSDVWSFGITLWEIFSLGQTPYVTIANNQLMHYIKQGQRLKSPMYGTGSLYRLMKECWALDKHDRPLLVFPLKSF